MYVKKNGRWEYERPLNHDCTFKSVDNIKINEENSDKEVIIREDAYKYELTNQYLKANSSNFYWLASTCITTYGYGVYYCVRDVINGNVGWAVVYDSAGQGGQFERGVRAVVLI